mgnify:CR=1 FL=1
MLRTLGRCLYPFVHTILLYSMVQIQKDTAIITAFVLHNTVPCSDGIRKCLISTRALLLFRTDYPFVPGYKRIQKDTSLKTLHI